MKAGRKPVLPPLPGHALGRGVGAYLASLQVRNYSESTIRGRRFELRQFLTWCEARGLEAPATITRAMLESYQRFLFHYRSPNGRPLSFSAQHMRLCAVRAWFKWLSRQGEIPANPASELDLPKLPQRLPKAVLTAEEAERVLAEAAGTSVVTLRDRAMLETLYSTGMRRMELGSLKLYDVDAERGTATIRQGKGKKDRTVPVGRRALRWIASYCERARPWLAREPDEGTLFLNGEGEPFSLDGLSILVAGYVDAAGIGKRGGCHLFRHTCATLMLEGGADIRFIQQLLGHVDISTTQIYARVSIRQLQRVHEQTHPASRQPEEPTP
jgi:integrase/recombinase XerD